MEKYVKPNLTKEEYEKLPQIFRQFFEVKNYKQFKRLIYSKPKKLVMFLVKLIPIVKYRRTLRKRLRQQTIKNQPVQK